jgi:hypothetical protein
MTPPHLKDLHLTTTIDPFTEISSKRPSISSDTMPEAEIVASDSRFLNDTELKAEVDTGDVSDQWFSFKKLWAYAGPGELTVDFDRMAICRIIFCPLLYTV